MGLKYPYIWAFCAFAALGACQYGYDGKNGDVIVPKAFTDTLFQRSILLWYPGYGHVR